MRFDAELWRHDGSAGWHFVTLPHDVADEIAERAAKLHRPFGSLPVRATIGATTWTTSLFADTKRARSRGAGLRSVAQDRYEDRA